MYYRKDSLTPFSLKSCNPSFEACGESVGKVYVGLGRIVASEIEAPITLVNLVHSG